MIQRWVQQHHLSIGFPDLAELRFTVWKPTSVGLHLAASVGAEEMHQLTTLKTYIHFQTELLVHIQHVNYFVFCNHKMQRGEQLFLSAASLCSSCQGFCLQYFFGIRVFVLTLKPEASVAVQDCGEEPRLFVWGWEALGGQFCASTAQWLWNVLLSDNHIRTFPFSSLLNKKL